MSLGETIRELIRMRARMRADGATPDELDRALETALRGSFPHREEPWHFLCSDCDDLGFIWQPDCPGGDFPTCRVSTKPHDPHRWGVPCWCAQGARYQPKREPDHTVPDLGQIGKTKRPQRPFRRWDS